MRKKPEAMSFLIMILIYERLPLYLCKVLCKTNVGIDRNLTCGMMENSVNE